MRLTKRWIMRGASEAAGALATSLKTSPIISQILINRGLTDSAACSRFLAPGWSELHQPASLANLSKAAERIVAAIRNQECIVIYGDYDVDGITATAILWHGIRLLGGK